MMANCIDDNSEGEEKNVQNVIHCRQAQVHLNWAR